MSLYFDQARFSCQGQYVRVRNGDSLNDELLADVAAERKEPETGKVVTTGHSLLLEFFNEEKSQQQQSDSSESGLCLAGFLAHVSMMRKRFELKFFSRVSKDS